MASFTGAITDCIAGDTLQMFAFQNTGGALSLTTTATQNWVSYKRIGN